MRNELAFKEVNGKLHPVNSDGSFHFDICREVWMKKVRAKGVPFEHGRTKGIEFEGKQILTEISFGPVTGKKYFKLEHDCCPWEYCAVCAPIIEKRGWK